ncbi:aldehyde dehydrogenase family protein [Paenibacillus yanchengensis]|uniref:Aldehyde dehydrogenase family protein n=1 Tax=Paenibacillus yanchengensis TaxID=2035833 RepID=A0ABW4YH45_9BACL
MMLRYGVKKLWIDGKWCEATKYSQLIAPYSKERIASIAVAGEADIAAAIAAADRARQTMKRMAAHERAAILERVAVQLKEREVEAAQLIAYEAAKPLKLALAEIERTVQTYKFAAEEAKRIYGETIPLDAQRGAEGKVAYTMQEPLGVIAAITPFNFPFNLVAHKVGPAIAAGNTVVLKPASQTPLSAYFIAEIFHQAGLPSGALNVITAPGAVAGDVLTRDERVAMITFTGSEQIGKQLQQQAGMKKVVLELGSNAALIVDNNVNIAAIAERVVTGAFAYQGQVCIAVQRIYVHESSYEQLVNTLVERSKQLKLGHPLELETNMSALISEREDERVQQWLEEAKAKGAKVVLGGTVIDGIFAPTIVVDAHPDLQICREELFAPVVVITAVSSMDEAFVQVNDSRYGLQAGIYTNDMTTALRAAQQLEVGGVIINDIPTFRVDHMPYGGVKSSGIGREGVKYAMQAMMQLKLVVMNSMPAAIPPI